MSETGTKAIIDGIKELWINAVLIRQIGIAFGLLLSVTGCNSSKPDLTLAVAANMQFVMTEIMVDFEAESGAEIAMVTGSSGKLYAQIKNGAPYDIYLAADTLFPSRLLQEHFTEEEFKVFALGSLVVWSKDSLTTTVPSFLWSYAHAFVHTPSKWALANPETAPYGAAANGYLLDLVLLEAMQPTMVKGESISQVNQFIYSKSVDFGFTSKSSVLAKGISPKFWDEIPISEYPPIQQTAVVIKATNNTALANEFIHFLSTKKSQERLRLHGYFIPNS